MDGRPLFPLADHRFRRGAVEPRQRLVRHGRDVLVFFFKQKTAYEMSLRDGVQTCALPISILSLQGEVIVPTGNKTHSLGTGTTTFETFAAFDQLFPTNTFVQFQMGADLPRHTDISPQSVFWRSALGQSFAADHGLGRLWSPMVSF